MVYVVPSSYTCYYSVFPCFYCSYTCYYSVFSCFFIVPERAEIKCSHILILYPTHSSISFVILLFNMYDESIVNPVLQAISTFFIRVHVGQDFKSYKKISGQMTEFPMDVSRLRVLREPLKIAREIFKHDRLKSRCS